MMIRHVSGKSKSMHMSNRSPKKGQYQTPLPFSKLCRGAINLALEELAEVGGFVETQLIGDSEDRQVCMRLQAFRFQNNRAAMKVLAVMPIDAAMAHDRVSPV